MAATKELSMNYMSIILVSCLDHFFFFLSLVEFTFFALVLSLPIGISMFYMGLKNRILSGGEFVSEEKFSFSADSRISSRERDRFAIEFFFHIHIDGKISVDVCVFSVTFV